MPAERLNGARTKAPSEAELLAAACAIVGESGLAGLTLRPLAQRLGVSVTVLSNRYGPRREVVAAIAEAARAQDAAFLQPWRERIAGLPDLDAQAAADLAELILDELAGPQRARAQFFVELVQAASWDEELRQALAAWQAERAEFWNTLAARAGMPAALVATGFVAGYFVDEGAYGIALRDIGAYRLLRRLALRRLFSGIGLARAGDAALFGWLFDELEYASDVLQVIHGAPIPQDWRARALQACALLITTRGVGGVTHRAVAEKAAVAPATLGYRFPTQEELVVAGLEFIITQLLRSVEEGTAATRDADAPDTLDVGRATFAVAVEASRLERLVPCAADMRRRRGINLRRVLDPRGEIGLDPLAAQVLAIGAIGLRCSLPPGPASGAAVDRGLALAFDWARRRLPG